MARGARKHRRRRGDESSDEEPSDEKLMALSSPSNKPNNNKEIEKLDFAARRQKQRQKAAADRKAKQRCYLCGETGHVRRECPGIADDGRGESRFKNAKGDRGSQSKGSKSRGRKEPIKEKSSLQLPSGFFSRTTDGGHMEDQPEPLLYYDASCNVVAALEYLRFGRGREKLSLKEASIEYKKVFSELGSNFGGCITRSFLRPNRPWVEPDLSFVEHSIWHVVGLSRDFLCNDEESQHAVDALLEAFQHDNVVGFFCDLDFFASYSQLAGCDKESQQKRMSATVQAAVKGGASLQIRISPSYTDSKNSDDKESMIYNAVTQTLFQILHEAHKQGPDLHVHLSAWSGTPSHMLSFLKAFPNLVIGINASVTFAKAKHMHECAFELDPSRRVVFETSQPEIIPSIVTKTLGRDAWGHSACIPWIAEGLASFLRDTDASEVATTATDNTLRLYPKIVSSRAASLDSMPQQDNGSSSNDELTEAETKEASG